MYKLLIHSILIIFLWAAIYPVTFLCFLLLDEQTRQELLWQIRFESHYLLIKYFVMDWLNAAYASLIWPVAVVISQVLRTMGSHKTAKYFLFLYPLILIAILIAMNAPAFFWYMAITGWIFNWFFMGDSK